MSKDSDTGKKIAALRRDEKGGLFVELASLSTFTLETHQPEGG
jgi:hypothetical protein